MRKCVLNVPEAIQNGQLISDEYEVKYKLVLVVVVSGGCGCGGVATAAAVFKWLLSLWSLSTLILAKAFKTTCMASTSIVLCFPPSFTCSMAVQG